MVASTKRPGSKLLSKKYVPGKDGFLPSYDAAMAVYEKYGAGPGGKPSNASLLRADSQRSNVTAPAPTMAQVRPNQDERLNTPPPQVTPPQEPPKAVERVNQDGKPTVVEPTSTPAPDDRTPKEVFDIMDKFNKQEAKIAFPQEKNVGPTATPKGAKPVGKQSVKALQASGYRVAKVNGKMMYWKAAGILSTPPKKK